MFQIQIGSPGGGTYYNQGDKGSDTKAQLRRAVQQLKLPPEAGFSVGRLHIGEGGGICPPIWGDKCRGTKR